MFLPTNINSGSKPATSVNPSDRLLGVPEKAKITGPVAETNAVSQTILGNVAKKNETTAAPLTEKSVVKKVALDPKESSWSDEVYANKDYQAMIDLCRKNYEKKEFVYYKIRSVFLEAKENNDQQFVKKFFEQIKNVSITPENAREIIEACNFEELNIIQNAAQDASAKSHVSSNIRFFEDIYAFAEKHDLIKELKKVCNEKDKFGYTHLDYANILGDKNLIDILKKIGVNQLNDGSAAPEEKRKAAFAELVVINAALFDSLGLGVHGGPGGQSINTGGQSLCALIHTINHLVAYKQEHREILTEADSLKIDRSIQELKNGIRMYRLSHLGDSKEAAALAMQLIKSLPPYDPAVSSLDEAPCVMMPSNVFGKGEEVGHAITCKVVRDGPSTFTFTTINTGFGSERNITKFGAPEKPFDISQNTKDVTYTGLKLDSFGSSLNETFFTEFFNFYTTEQDTGWFKDFFGNGFMGNFNTFIDKSLLNKEENNRKYGREHSLQLSATCFYKSISSFLQGRLGKPLCTHYKHFMTRRSLNKMFPKEGPTLWKRAGDDQGVDLNWFRQAGADILNKRLKKAMKLSKEHNVKAYEDLQEKYGKEIEPETRFGWIWSKTTSACRFIKNNSVALFQIAVAIHLALKVVNTISRDDDDEQEEQSKKVS